MIEFFLSILTRKRHPQIKPERLREVRIWTFGQLVHQITLYEVLKLKQKFRKKLKQLLAKDRSLRQVPFVFPFLFVLTLASDRAILYGNVAFSILLLSIKKSYSSFQKKVFVFKKICFKVIVLKTFKVFSDFHIKKCRSLKRKAILKITSPVFQKNLCSFCRF